MITLRIAAPALPIVLVFTLTTPPCVAQEVPTTEVRSWIEGHPGEAPAWTVALGAPRAAPWVARRVARPAPADARGVSDPARDRGSKSPALAGGLEFFIPVPTLGYAYAGDWRRGLLPGGVQVAGMVVMTAGITEAVLEGLSGNTESDCGSLCALGITMVIGGRVWSTVGAARAARRWNLDGGGSLAVQWVPGPSGGGVWAAYRF